MAEVTGSMAVVTGSMAVGTGSMVMVTGSMAEDSFNFLNTCNKLKYYKLAIMLILYVLQGFIISCVLLLNF